MAANGVGLKYDCPGDIDKSELESQMEQFHRESLKVAAKRAVVDRAYKEKLTKATDAINKACIPG
jgi:hypothetical protein